MHLHSRYFIFFKWMTLFFIVLLIIFYICPPSPVMTGSFSFYFILFIFCYNCFMLVTIQNVSFLCCVPCFIGWHILHGPLGATREQWIVGLSLSFTVSGSSVPEPDTGQVPNACCCSCLQKLILFLALKHFVSWVLLSFPFHRWGNETHKTSIACPEPQSNKAVKLGVQAWSQTIQLDN